MTLNEHDDTRRARRFSQHVAQLADAFGVAVNASLPMKHMDQARAATLRPRNGQPTRFEDLPRVIVIAPVTDETTYAAALHELGHMIHPLGRISWLEGSRDLRATGRPSTLRDVRLRLTGERAAWEWAHAFALEWTEVMTFVETSCLAEYLKDARRFGALGEP